MSSITPPSVRQFAGEFPGLARGLVNVPPLLTVPAVYSRGVARGTGPVLCLPGLSTDDLTTLPMRRYFSRLGYDTYGWELGRNTGQIKALAPIVADRISEIAEHHSQPVSLVGWSLGGVIAREASRIVPHLVGTIVTMGSPIVGGPKYTVLAQVYRRLGVDLDDVESRIADTARTPLPLPVTVIYSRRDGIVGWRACLDPYDYNKCEHVQVRATHWEMGLDPEALGIAADRLAHGVRVGAPVGPVTAPE